jgi:hypothetical protein
MSDYAERLVSEVRAVLRRVQEGIVPARDAAKALDGIASAMDGSVPVAVRDASRRLANDVELLAYGGTTATLAEASTRFESAIGPAGLT